MNRKIFNEVKKLAKILADGIDAKQIYLFGSFANGNETKDSNIDLYVLTNLANRNKIDVIKTARRLLINKTKMPIDILVNDFTEVESRKTKVSTFEYVVANEGLLLYG
jgi:uncharacterized protein